MKKLRRAVRCILSVVFSATVLLIPAYADEEYIVLFDIFDVPAIEWDLTQATNETPNEHGGGRIEVVNENGEYSFINMGGRGWPNAVIAFGDDVAETMNWPREMWKDVTVHFDFEVTNNANVMVYDWDALEGNDIRIVGAFVDLDDDFSNRRSLLSNSGDLLAGHYQGTRTLYQVLNSRFTVTETNRADIFNFEWVNFVEDNFIFAGLQIFPVGGDVIIRDFRITMPETIPDNTNITTEPIDGSGDAEPLELEERRVRSEGLNTGVVIGIASSTFFAGMVVGIVLGVVLYKKKEK